MHIARPKNSQPRWGHERGASLVEYALLIALIAAACVLAVTFFGSSTADSFSKSGSAVSAD